jgi:excisionase family DNA binding protein
VTEPLLISIREASRRLGLGRDATYEAARVGRLRVLRVGRRLYVPEAELAAFVEREVERKS